MAHQDATLGMTRLAIVDISQGHQPMANEDESIVIVYNGEVYNAPALRQQLELRGVRFRSRSDTEVILRLYEVDPEHVEEHLVGMWAFAIHDRRRRRVVLSRDRFGIKPLFIADTGTALAFASELRCFDQSVYPFSKLFEIDHDAAHAVMSWSYTPETSTIYQGVKRLRPATRLTVDLASGRREARTYWTLTPSHEAALVHSLDDACEQVDVLLKRAVQEHLESDVPVAVFLSGGIDSSLVSAYATEASKGSIEAYSNRFSGARLRRVAIREADRRRARHSYPRTDIRRNTSASKRRGCTARLRRALRRFIEPRDVPVVPACRSRLQSRYRRRRGG